MFIVFTNSFYLIININSLYMCKNFYHHNFGLGSPCYIVFILVFLQNKAKDHISQLSSYLWWFYMPKKIQWKLLIDNQFFLCKVIIKYNGFGMQDFFLWVQFFNTNNVLIWANFQVNILFDNNAIFSTQAIF